MKILNQKKQKSYTSFFLILFVSFLLNSCYKNVLEPSEQTTLLDFIFPEAELTDTKAFIENSPYSSIIEESILYDGSYTTLSDLPLIGMETDSPTIDDIMQRLVVSHNWMGHRFQEILETYPPDFLKIFRSVTAIVIDDDIRPSFYNPGTATIYLDANYFWLNENEKNCVNPKLDYRSNYSKDLNFEFFRRYVKNNEMAYFHVPAYADFQPRELEDIRLEVARVLLHELAHASDYFPPNYYNNLDNTKEPWDAANDIKNQWISKRLYQTIPLNSEILKDLGQVSFHGKTATDFQKSLSATDVGANFETDVATDYYSYSTKFEDVAMLFEVTMMKYFFDVDNDIAFTDRNNGNDKYIIRWGVRNRFASSNIYLRADFVIKEILPEINFDNFSQNLPIAQNLPNGIDWQDSLDNLQPYNKSISKKRIYYNEPLY